MLRTFYLFCLIIFDLLKVGGEFSSSVIYRMKNFGRVSVCGSISSYNANPKDLPKGKLEIVKLGYNYFFYLYLNLYI
jgi:hypothetical protein